MKSPVLGPALAAVRVLTRRHWPMPLFVAVGLAGGGWLAIENLPGLAAQTPTRLDEKPTFEVASIQMSQSDQQGGPYFMPGGRLRATGITLRLLMRIAYSYGRNGALFEHQILGGPKWIDSEKFDMEATAATGPSDPLALLRLQSLLEERFKLRTHAETRVVPIYALVVANRNRTLGRRIRSSEMDCPDFQGVPPPPPPAGSSPEIQCGLRGGAGRASGRGVEMGRFVRLLSASPDVGRMVIDNTGLTGRFDLDIEWTPGPLHAAFGTPDVNVPPPMLGPTIFSALEEQLGLKLESRRGPVEVTVIDAVERPLPN